MKKMLNGLVAFALFSTALMAADQVTVVEARGSCAIAGYTADHARQLALQHARGAAIEKAEGFAMNSYTVIKDGAMAVDMIRSFVSGFIVEEQLQWDSKFFDHDDDPSTAPIPEHIVYLTAKVKKVKKKRMHLITTELNQKIFNHGDKAFIKVESSKEVQIALFYYGQDDRIYRVAPTVDMDDIIVRAQSKFVFPDPDSDYELVMETLKNYDEVAEAFIVVAVPTSEEEINLKEVFFKDEYQFNEFFRTYAKIAEYAYEDILPYRVFAKR